MECLHGKPDLLLCVFVLLGSGVQKITCNLPVRCYNSIVKYLNNNNKKNLNNARLVSEIIEYSISIQYNNELIEYSDSNFRVFAA